MLILASASPRRRELLAQAGFTFDVHTAAIDETPRAAEQPAAYTLRLATEKAEAIAARFPHSTVLAADTTVVCDGHILGKPEDAADAARMLRQLSGRTHEVITSIAVCRDGLTRTASETTVVTFSAIPGPELAAYVATGEPLDKAGAYGIQGYAARWIPRIEGCYFNVVGLPLSRTVSLLASVGIQRLPTSELLDTIK